MNGKFAELAAHAYSVLLPAAQLMFVVVVIVLLPMGLFRRTRSVAGEWLYFSSYVFGITTWLLGAAVTFAAFGWIGLIVGLFFMGVGVVPMAIFAAFFKLDMTGLGVSLIVMCVLVYATRSVGAALMASGPQRAP